jgi:hypothetical protein
LEVALAAIVAEAKGFPAPQTPPTEEAVTSAMTALESKLSSEQANRFRTIQATFNDSGDEDTCWWYRTLLGTMPRLDKSHQATLARALVEE